MKIKYYYYMLKIGNRVLFIWQSRYPEIMLTLQNNQQGWLECILLMSFKITAECARKLGKSSATKVKWAYVSREVKKAS